MTTIILHVDDNQYYFNCSLVTLQSKLKTMYIFLFLIIVSMLVAVVFLGAFFWAVKSGQYEDDVTPAMRILLDDEPTETE